MSTARRSSTRSSDGDSMPTSRSTTASASSSSRRPARSARSSSGRTSSTLHAPSSLHVASQSARSSTRRRPVLSSSPRERWVAFAAPRPITRATHGTTPGARRAQRRRVQLGERSGGCAAACRGRSWRAREAHGSARQGVGRQVRRVHGGRLRVALKAARGSDTAAIFKALDACCEDDQA